MPELNIEEKIQEALKKKSFKDNKKEYLGLALVFCLILYITFVIGYFVPFLAIFIFFLVDIPLMMGFKHFIWFGPASGETLIEGFKVSLICGYLNFVSYIKIFITTNLKPLLFSLLAILVSSIGASFVINQMFSSDMSAILEGINEQTTNQELMEMVFENDNLRNAMIVSESIALGIGVLTFFILKLTRGVLPYISFLRLTSLEGKSMEGVITHTRKVIKAKPGKYYMNTLLVHLLYLIPIFVTVGMYFIIKSNPVYSPTTLTLICSLAFFITMSPAVLFVELNYRNYCIEANQNELKEHKKMLNDAINDLKNR